MKQNDKKNTTPTPAPWHVKLDPVTLSASVHGSPRFNGQRRQHVAEVWSGDDCSMEVVKANAALISAAPAMRDALADLLDNLEEVHRDEVESNHGGDGAESCSYCRSIAAAKSALEKAGGK